jgi:Putative peptidoglycan binding domain
MSDGTNGREETTKKKVTPLSKHLRKHPLVSTVLAISTMVTGLAAFTDGADKIIAFTTKYFWSSPPPPHPLQVPIGILPVPGYHAAILWDQITIREVKQILHDQGFYEGPIDETDDPLFRRAVKDFQKSQGMEDDGWVGPLTAARLREVD